MYYLGILGLIAIGYYAVSDNKQMYVLYGALGLLVAQVVWVVLTTKKKNSDIAAVKPKPRSDGRAFNACGCTDPSTGSKATGQMIDGRCYCIANVTKPWTTASYCTFLDDWQQKQVTAPNIGVNKHGQLLCNAPY